MAIKLAINGFGRIGRNILRALYESERRHEFEIVAINELAKPEGIAHLLKYDTAHGRFSFPVELREQALVVDGDEIALYCEQDPSALPWHQHDVDIVLECSGVFHSREDAQNTFRQALKKYYFLNPQMLMLMQRLFMASTMMCFTVSITLFPMARAQQTVLFR